jgi:glycosyltransferase involved in cell wall biosynthesis
MMPAQAPRPLPPLRILFVVSSLHGGGAEFVARTWMGWLTGRGHEVSVVLVSESPNPRDYLPAGVRLLRLTAPRGQVAKANALRALLFATKPQVAIALQTHPNLVLLAASLMIPRAERPQVVISERNIVSLGLPGASVSHRAKVLAAKRLYRRADHVIAISHPVAAELIAGFGVRGERLTVVPNPATAKLPTTGAADAAVRGPETGSTAAAARAALAAPATRRRRPGSDNGIQIVVACRLVPQKRPLLAIDAAAELARRGISVEVVTFGDGPLLRELADAADQAGVDFWHRGWVENWFESLADNAVVVLPSVREGFGNVLVEAAAAGHPTVAMSGALGVADAVVPGITGELALSADPGDLADAILRAAALPLDRALIEPWLRRYSIDASGAALESMLLRTVGAAPGPGRR